MKLTAIIILSACLTATANGYAQKVTLSEKNAPLEKLFREIRRQTGYNFLYNDAWLQQTKKVTIQVTNAPLVDALNICFTDQPFTWSIVEQTIVVKQKTETTPNEPTVVDLPPPPIDISGKVTDKDGLPLAGASITVKGNKSNGTSTNSDGVFVLKGLDADDVITISYTGFKEQSFKVGGRTSWVLNLERNESPLDEVMVKAYGTTTRRFEVGNITKVSGEEIQRQPVDNVLKALEGRVPGLFITQTNGLNGGGVTVRIQGETSMRNGNDPLYVIDGMPFLSQLPSTTTALDGVLGASGGKTNGAVSGAGSPLSYINISDIESIEVLKDADATAIYGSRAANGAILITTKKGKAGRTKVDINLQNGWGKVPKMVDMLNTQQYLEMRREGLRNDGLVPTSNPSPLAGSSLKYAPDLMIWDTTRFTDWQKLLIGGTAQFTNITASVSGGNNNTQFLLSSTYNKQTTVFPGDFNDEKVSVHFNINSSSSNKKLSLQFSGSYLTDNNKVPTKDFTQYITLSPNAPALFNPDGSLNWALNSAGISTWDNPYSYFYSTYTNSTSSLQGNALVTYHILPGLDFKNSMGYNEMQTNDMAITPLVSIAPESRTTSSRSGLYGNRKLKSWIIEPQLSYKKAVLGGILDLLIGSTIQKNNNTTEALSGQGFNSDQVMKDIRSAATVSVNGSSIIESKYNALFGRLNYRLNEKYIVDFSARRDGSSRFGPESRFHNFWSIAGAWILSEEKILKQIRLVSFAKLKASYGTTGSDQIGDYSYLNLYNPTSGIGIAYQGGTGLAPNSLPNPYLEWEETRKLSLGTDLGFINDRILLSVNYARNQSSNQLLSYSLPSVTGFTTITKNFPATVRNTSWEFSLSTKNIQTSQFLWKTSIVLTLPNNKLVKFDDIMSSPYATTYIVGQPLSIKFLYHYLGVDPQTGLYTYSDIRGNATRSLSYPSDFNIYRTSYQKYDGGFSNSFSYKGFNIDVFFSFVQRYGENSIYSTKGVPGTWYKSATTGGNQLTTVMSHWQKPGDMSTIQRFNASDNGGTNPTGSDAGYSNAFFTRLKNVAVSYELPAKWKQKLHAESFRIYSNGQNLLSISNYKGLDPETLTISRLPPLKVITIGLQVIF